MSGHLTANYFGGHSVQEYAKFKVGDKVRYTEFAKQFLLDTKIELSHLWLEYDVVELIRFHTQAVDCSLPDLRSPYGYITPRESTECCANITAGEITHCVNIKLLEPINQVVKDGV